MAATPTTPGCLLPCDPQARLLASPATGPGLTPWTGYLRLAHGQWVGGGGFAAAPLRGQVEIGYFTLPGWQQQGHGLATAAALLAIARAADAQLTVTATTVRTPGSTADASPSGRILQRLGFGPPVPALDAAAGPVWHWAAEPPQAAPNTRPAHPSTPARTPPCPAPP